MKNHLGMKLQNYEKYKKMSLTANDLLSAFNGHCTHVIGWSLFFNFQKFDTTTSPYFRNHKKVICIKFDRNNSPLLVPQDD